MHIMMVAQTTPGAFDAAGPCIKRAGDAYLALRGAV
jgi:hypothetical protein